MKYPKLREIPTTREMIDVFRGYNHNLRIADGEFYDMKNLSSDHYPVFATRQKRGIYASPQAPKTIIAKDKVCYVDGTDLVIGEERIPMVLTVDDTPKSLVSMGAYIIVFPDGKYVNTATNVKTWQNIAHSITDTCTAKFCLKDGSAVEESDVKVSPLKPTERQLYWIDNSVYNDPILKQYDYNAEEYIEIGSPYTRIESGIAGDLLNAGDVITVTCTTQPLLSGQKEIFYADGGSGETVGIVIPGLIQEATEAVTGKEITVTIQRKLPSMDFVVESGNRLWGCRYSTDNSINEIYASALGDFTNWYRFEGISTDSYAASVGTDGPFTGAITYRGHPIFFKENFMHTVYGDYPANFQIQTNACRGVQNGCEKSLSIVNEVLYYKSRSGICAYDGSLPAEISAALGDVDYHNAVAGTLGNKYYISMQDDSELWHLFVYDTSKGLWHREDDTQAVEFCNCHGELYYIDYADKQIKTVRGTGIPESGPIKWEAVTGILGTDLPDKKYISRLDVRMSLQTGARSIFFAEYDSSGEWEYLFTMDGVSLRSFAVPIRPQRCDHMRLKIVGTGDAKIFSICKTVEEGSDV